MRYDGFYNGLILVKLTGIGVPMTNMNSHHFDALSEVACHAWSATTSGDPEESGPGSPDTLRPLRPPEEWPRRLSRIRSVSPVPPTGAESEHGRRPRAELECTKRTQSIPGLQRAGTSSQRTSCADGPVLGATPSCFLPPRKRSKSAAFHPKVDAFPCAFGVFFAHASVDRNRPEESRGRWSPSN